MSEMDTLNKVRQIEDVSGLMEFLREFRGWNADEYTYDFGEVFLLFIALLDNFIKHSPGEIHDIGDRIYDVHRELLVTISNAAKSVSDSEIDKDI